MNPLEFIETAKFLNRDNKEASIRSAVSRSYYAMIIHIKRNLEILIGQRFQRGENIHELIPRYLKYSGSIDAITIAQMIVDLRDKRNEADYEMKLNFGEIDKLQITIAEEIICKFDSLDKTKLEGGIRAYLKKLKSNP